MTSTVDIVVENHPIKIQLEMDEIWPKVASSLCTELRIYGKPTSIIQSF